MEDDIPYSFTNNIDARILSDHASLANLMSEVETPSPTAVEEIPQRFALINKAVTQECKQLDPTLYPKTSLDAQTGR